MPILIILLLVASVMPVAWPPAAFALTASETLALTACLVFGSIAASAVVSAAVARTMRKHPERRDTAARQYVWWRRFAFYLNVGISLTAIFALGWGAVVREAAVIPWHGQPVLAPFADLLVPGPYLFTLAVNWLVYWPAERALHRGGRADRPFWSLFGYWVYEARRFAFTVLLPVLLFATHQSASRLLPETAASAWYQVGTTAAALALMVLLPRLIRPLLGLKSLPPGPTRDRLEATARRLGVRVTDLLLWPTHGAMANAMVIGVTPLARYVIFTDRLLDALDADELDAVFGHEIGHVRYGHLPYYMLFLILSATAVTAVTVPLLRGLSAAGLDTSWWADLAVLPPLAVTGAYLFVVFGWLSRACERQADLYGSRAGSCGRFDCTGHDADTVLVAGGRGLCATGLHTMARALERVLLLNGWEAEHPPGTGIGGVWRRALRWFRAWQHGPMPARMDYLLRVTERPTLADAHDRWAFRQRALLILVLLAVLVVGAFIGGKELWTAL